MKTFFKVDLPDQVIYPESNCSPMDMVWMIYNNMVGGGPLPEQERFTKALFYACRTGFKTLGAAIVEILALIHDGRGVCHIAAGESHVKHCYNDYVQPYLRAHPLIWELIENSIMEKTITKTRVILEAMPCTKKRVQGPHQPLVCLAGDNLVQTDKYGKISLEEFARKDWQNCRVLSYNEKTQCIEYQPCVNAVITKNNTKDMYEIELTNGYKVRCTQDHEIFTQKGWVKAQNLTENDSIRVKIQSEGIYINCKMCNKYYKVQNYRFKKTKKFCCSYKCNRKDKIYVKCNRCSKEIMVYPYELSQKTFYCGRKCKEHKVKVMCAICGKEKLIPHSQYEHNRTGKFYCQNLQCNMTTFSCLNCSKENKRPSYFYKPYSDHFCNNNCRLEYYRKYNKDEYDLKFTKELKKRIYKRDYYTCQNCGKYPIKRCVAHHIDYNKLNSEEWNLITLCDNCHSQTNSKRQYWESKFSNEIRKISKNS